MGTLAVLLKESWSRVEAQADELANLMYARMFLADEGIRELFPVGLTGQRARFVTAIASIIQLVEDPEQFNRIMRQLGRDHRRFHVSSEHYGVMGAALIEALREVSGPMWSLEYEQAWSDAYEAMAARMRIGAEQDEGPAFWHAEVVAHERRGRDIAVFTVRPLAPYAFQAGQYASLESPYLRRMWSSHAIANAPRLDGTLDFHVRAGADAWVAASLVRRLRAGDLLRLGPPMGTMTLDESSSRDIVCVADGMGFAQARSLLDELCYGNRSRRVHLFIGARDRDDLYDLDQLRHLVQRHPWLSVFTACSDDDTFPGERGPVNELVERYGPWPRHDVFVCGSPAMVKATLGTLTRMGVPWPRVRYDSVVSTGE